MYTRNQSQYTHHLGLKTYNNISFETLVMGIQTLVICKLTLVICIKTLMMGLMTW